MAAGNPLAKQPEYKQSVQRMLPDLLVLDGDYRCIDCTAIDEWLAVAATVALTTMLLQH